MLRTEIDAELHEQAHIQWRQSTVNPFFTFKTCRVRGVIGEGQRAHMKEMGVMEMGLQESLNINFLHMNT